ncbi:MAG: LysR substrate-binding domain-containing protein [Promethearchaeota archaeon]
MTGEIIDLKDDLRLRALKTFLTLVETGGSFSRTAEKLNLTQGTVSNHINALETFFNAELFYKVERVREDKIERVSEGENLTQAGMMILERVREIIAILNRTKEDIERLKGEITGTLRIATSTIPGEHILPKFMAIFKAEHPTVEFEVDLSDSGKSLEKLLAKESDLAAVGCLVGYEAEIETFPITEEELVLIVPPEHELASNDPVDPKMLVKHQLITREKTSGTRNETERILETAGLSIDDFQSILELGSTEAVITAVSEGYGISVISSIAAKKAENYVNIIPLKSIENKRKLFMVRRARESYPVLVETFWDFIKNSATENE